MPSRRWLRTEIGRAQLVEHGSQKPRSAGSVEIAPQVD